MDACLKKERLCTLFVRVGAPEGGVWGRGGRSGGSSPKIGRAFLQKTIPCLLCTFIIITWMQDAFALSEPILVAIQLIYNTLPSISHCSSPDYFCVVCWRPELKFPYTLNSLPRICSLHVSCISLSLLPPRTRIEAHRGMNISCPPFFLCLTEDTSSHNLFKPTIYIQIYYPASKTHDFEQTALINSGNIACTHLVFQST